ncbi:MAG TPA: hypothetical protein VMU16_14600 [Candidatus Binataceae bacterium]|nr:hypothetical protein [Candidatus Binataceae bacterium]
MFPEAVAYQVLGLRSRHSGRANRVWGFEEVIAEKMPVISGEIGFVS